MTGHDRTAADDNDGLEDVEEVEEHHITAASAPAPRKAETERIRYNPSRKADR